MMDCDVFVRCWFGRGVLLVDYRVDGYLNKELGFSCIFGLIHLIDVVNVCDSLEWILFCVHVSPAHP